jgi:hypothetical protein
MLVNAIQNLLSDTRRGALRCKNWLQHTENLFSHLTLSTFCIPQFPISIYLAIQLVTTLAGLESDSTIPGSKAVCQASIGLDKGTIIMVCIGNASHNTFPKSARAAAAHLSPGLKWSLDRALRAKHNDRRLSRYIP